MKVFKFGGASVKDVDSVKNVATIINKFPNENLIIVISAMGKMTNALEELVKSIYNNKSDKFEIFNNIKSYHNNIIEGLFSENKKEINNEINKFYNEIEEIIKLDNHKNFDKLYSQIVAFGELLGTKIVSLYLNDIKIKNNWIDIRSLIKTEKLYTDARVKWQETVELLNKNFNGLTTNEIILTQGFIASDSNGDTTTLGREGSDFTGAILAYSLNAESLTIWKDVPGVLNADPKWFDETQILSNISYKEAVELAYFGATVIHPKTIKPLQNKNIPLLVKSFVNPNNPGTIINNNTSEDSIIPSFIFKMNQILISISTIDYSFIMEDNLSEIFGLFAKHGIKINLMQNSAISFSAAFDYNKFKLESLLNDLKNSYTALINENLELVTIRHFDEKTINRVKQGKDVLIIQQSRSTIRMIMKDLGLFN